MYAIEGTLNGAPYTVVLDPDRDTNIVGCVSGSRAAGFLLEAYDGQPFTLQPSGGDVVLDVDDPWTVEAFLRVNSRITRTEGDAPEPPDDHAIPDNAVT